jgi:peroxiredoxin
MTIGKGDIVKNFTLKDQDNQEISLSDFSGKKVLLSFHPLAWTGICAQQMQSLENNYSAFGELNTVPLGISVDTSPSKKAWAKELGIEHVRLLADFWPHGALAQELGIFPEDKGISGRVNIILDQNQQVIFIKVYPIGDLPEISEILQWLKK